MKANNERELQRMGKALKSYLRRQGFLFSETPLQAEKLQEAVNEENLPSYPGNPQKIFNRVMNIEAPVASAAHDEPLPQLKMIARNGLKLSDETLRKMNED